MIIVKLNNKIGYIFATRVFGNVYFRVSVNPDMSCAGCVFLSIRGHCELRKNKHQDCNSTIYKRIKL